MFAEPWGTVPVICRSYSTAPSLPSGPYTLHSQVPMSFCDTWGISKVGPIWELWPSKLRGEATSSLLLVGAESRCVHWKRSCPWECVRLQMSSKRFPSETGPWMLGVTVAKAKKQPQESLQACPHLFLVHSSAIAFFLYYSLYIIFLSFSFLRGIIKSPRKAPDSSRVQCSAMP